MLEISFACYSCIHPNRTYPAGAAAMVQERISGIMAIHDLNLTARFSDKLVMLKSGKIYAAGEPKALLSEDNISRVYGIQAMVMNAMGRPYIVPLHSISIPIECD